MFVWAQPLQTWFWTSFWDNFHCWSLTCPCFFGKLSFKKECRWTHFENSFWGLWFSSDPNFEPLHFLGKCQLHCLEHKRWMAKWNQNSCQTSCCLVHHWNHPGVCKISSLSMTSWPCNKHQLFQCQQQKVSRVIVCPKYNNSDLSHSPAFVKTSGDDARDNFQKWRCFHMATSLPFPLFVTVWS